jgi:hypothetical protein
MSRRPPSTYHTADELKQITANKFNEGSPSTPGPDPQGILSPANRPQNFGKIEGYLASKELEPPK